MVYATMSEKKEVVLGAMKLLSCQKLPELTVGLTAYCLIRQSKMMQGTMQQEKDIAYLKANTEFFMRLDNTALFANVNGATFVLNNNVWELASPLQRDSRDLLLEDCIAMEKGFDGKQHQVKLNIFSPYSSGNWYDIVCQIGNKCLVAVDSGFGMFEKTTIRKVSDYVDYKYSNVINDFCDSLYNDLSQKIADGQTLQEYISQCKENSPIVLLPSQY